MSSSESKEVFSDDNKPGEDDGGIQKPSSTISLQTYVMNHDFSRLMKPIHRNPLIADKGKMMSDVSNKSRITNNQPINTHI